jgi:hypothetical protein
MVVRGENGPLFGGKSMSVAVELTSEEIAQIKQLTRLDDDSQAVGKAVREFLRLSRLRELKAVSGKVDFVDNWKQLESLELEEMQFPE